MKNYQSVIMVVEDDVSDRELIKMAFGGLGRTVVVHFVNDGSEAIAYMMGESKYSDRDKHPYPTFIITDLKMPRVSGLEVLAHDLDAVAVEGWFPTRRGSWARLMHDEISQHQHRGINKFHPKTCGGRFS